MVRNDRRWAPDHELELKKAMYRFMGEMYATKAALYLKASETEWLLVGQYGFNRRDRLARSFSDDEPIVRMVRAFDHDPRYYNERTEVGELSAVEPDLLIYAWQAAVDETPDAGAELEVDGGP